MKKKYFNNSLILNFGFWVVLDRFRMANVGCSILAKIVPKISPENRTICSLFVYKNGVGQL